MTPPLMTSRSPAGVSPVITCSFSGRMPSRSCPGPHRRTRQRDQHAGAVHVGDEPVPGGACHGALDHVGLPEEVRDERRARRVVQLDRGSHLLDPPGVHDRDGVGHGHGLLLVMGDVHEREADLGLDPLELHLHLAPQLQVQRAERLVEQQHAGLVHDRAGERDPLLLAARELGGLAPGQRGELGELEDVVDLLLDGLGPAPPEPEGHVLEHVHVREQRVALEHRVDRPLVGLGPRDVGGADLDPAGRRVLEPRHHAQGRRLATAGRAEQREEGALRDREVDVVDRLERTELLGHPGEDEVAARAPVARYRGVAHLVSLRSAPGTRRCTWSLHQQ